MIEYPTGHYNCLEILYEDKLIRAYPYHCKAYEP